MRTTFTCLAGSLLLLVASLLPARAASAMEADPAVWGVYAKLLGRTWEAPGKYTVTVNWAVPGEVITETWISPTTKTVEGTVTVTRGAQPGELVSKSSPVPMKWAGRIVDADTVVFERAFPPRLAYRIRFGAAGFEHQRVKLDGGAVVAVTSTDHYTAAVVPGATPAPATAPAVAEGGKKGAKKGGKKGASPAAPAAPAGPHPVRVVGGTEVIAATFKDGVSGIDGSGARYDCYLIDTRPGDRWDVQVEADDASVPNLVVGQFRSVDAADCGASAELAAKRKEAWLSHKQTYSMTAGGGYYWFVPTGLPERSYTLRFKRKEGKVDAGMAAAGVAQLPAPLVASDRGPVTPVLEDETRRKQRVAAVEAVYARLAGRTYRGQETWHAEREQLAIPYKQYQWRGKGGELQIKGGQVLATGVQADPTVHTYGVDPVAGVFRAGDATAYVEHLPADDNALRVVAYGRDAAGRRARTSSFVMSLLPDGGQAFDGKPLYTPTTPAKLAALAPAVQQNEIAQRAAAAEQRRLLAEQQAREEQERSERGSWIGGLVGAVAGGAAVAHYGGDATQILGGAMKGAQIGNPNSQVTAALGAQGEAMISGGNAGASAPAGMGGGGASYPTQPNLAAATCARVGMNEGNYKQVALSGGNDVQLKTMCGQAFEYYVMYKRAIAQGYSEADANRTYAAHSQSAQVANGFLSSHGAD